MPEGKKEHTPSTTPDYIWPGFENLAEPLKRCHRQFFQELSGRNPLTLREYRRAFRTLYLFMQVEGLESLSDLTPQHLEALQHWCYQRYHWSPGNMKGLLLTLRRIGRFLKRLGLLRQSPFEWGTLAQPHRKPQDLIQPISWFHAVRRYVGWLKTRGIMYEVRKRYLRYLQRFYQFLKEDGLSTPGQIAPERIERFKAFLVVHLEADQRPLSVFAQRDTARRAASFYRWLVQEGLISAEPEKPSVPMEQTTGERVARLRRVVQEFLAYVWMRYAAETQQQYARSMRRFQEWVAARPKGKRVRDIDQLTPEVLAAYQRWINSEAAQRDGSPLTQPERESRLYPLKAFLGFCYRKGFLKEDLRRFVRVPRREYRVPRELLTPEEMARLLEVPSESSTSGIRDRALLELCYSGLRVSELLGLKIEEVDLEQNRVFISQGKGDKERMIPMTSAARYWLARWLRRRLEFHPKEDQKLLFISKKGRPIGRRTFGKMLVKYVQSAGLATQIGPHDLRRITATHLAANGAPMRYVQALLGHESLHVTTKYLRLTHVQIKGEYDRTHPSSQRARHTAASA